MKIFEITNIMPSDPEQCADLIIKDCAYFLELSDFNPLKPTRSGLIRGIKPPLRSMEKIAVSLNRKPVDTSPAIHEILNDYFEDNFDYPYRSAAVFCSGSERVAGAYGTPHVIFPVGKFKYVWSKTVEDAYEFFEAGADKNVVSKSSNTDLIDQYHDTGSKTILHRIIKEYLRDNPDLYQSTDLKSAIQQHPYRGNEIMIACGYYYAIPLQSATSTAILNALAAKIDGGEEEWT